MTKKIIFYKKGARVAYYIYYPNIDDKWKVQCDDIVTSDDLIVYAEFIQGGL